MKQITAHLYQIKLGFVNAFLLEDGTDLTLVDTGTPGSADKIFSIISKAGKDPQNIKRIILTHCHPDHSGSAAEIKRRLNVPVYAHAADAKIMEQGLASHGLGSLTPGIINWIVYNLFIKRAPKTMEPIVFDDLLLDNQVLPIVGGVQVIHTPGHSAGHVALLIKQDEVLIAADICANAAGLALSTMYDDRNLGIKSILKAAGFGFDKAVFGHGELLHTNASKKMKEKFGK